MGKDKSSAMPAAVTASELDEFRTLLEERSAILFDASRERFFAPRVINICANAAIRTPPDFFGGFAGPMWSMTGSLRAF
jgi:hypothetical protein